MQQFEWLLERALKLVFADKKELTPEKIFKADKRSLGILIGDLRARTSIKDDVDLWLADLLEERNLFVHRLRHQDWFDAHNRAGRDSTWEFFQRFQPKLERGIMLFTAIHFKHGEDLGFDSEFFRFVKKTDYFEAVARYYPDVHSIKKKG